MTEKSLRHLIALCMTAICALAYLGGYFSGGQAWWWTSFAVPIVYFIVLKVLHHH
ncbi:MAG: hypothetical protein AAB390_04395 [Patescibacteria group bacterium]